MAKIEVVMPQMGESITTGTITKWNKKPGDEIEIDEILLDISTDKVESEIPSPVGGRLEVIHHQEGETVDVGVLIAEIETDLSVPFGSGSTSAAAPKKEPVSVAVEAAVAEAPVQEVTSSGERKFYTPLVRAMAKEYGMPLSDLDKIQGTGAGGRVNKSDLEKFLSNKDTATARPQAAPTLATTQPSERVEITPMDNMRKVIAKNMVASKQTSPHVNSISDVDLTNLVKFREGFKTEFKKQEGFNLTYSHFIMWALVKALKEYPLLNSSVEGDNIVRKKYINLGCAVAVGDGLVVPNVKDADTLNITGIAKAVDNLANKARNKKLGADDMADGTFTFTNNGSFGTLMATPIILQPQVGIYCAGAIKKTVVVMPDDSLAIRSIMYGTHTYDHRLIDGATGGRFLEHVHNLLATTDFKTLF